MCLCFGFPSFLFFFPFLSVFLPLTSGRRPLIVRRPEADKARGEQQQQQARAARGEQHGRQRGRGERGRSAVFTVRPSGGFECITLVVSVEGVGLDPAVWSESQTVAVKTAGVPGAAS